MSPGHALMLVIAIMAFLACLTLGAVSMVRSTAQSWQSQISREITIQIKPDDKLDMEKALADARDLALTFVGTTDGNIVDKAATARLLEPWLGEGLDLDELPVPRLVIITIDEKNPPDFTAMRTMLTESIPQAYLDDHRTWVDRLVAMAHTTAMIGTGVLVLVFSAMVLTVIFATRGTLSGNRHIVEVLHFVGAEAGFVASEFQKHFLKISLKGAGAGGLLAATCFAIAGFWQIALDRHAAKRPGDRPVWQLHHRLYGLSRHCCDHDRHRASDHANRAIHGDADDLRDRPDPLRPGPYRYAPELTKMIALPRIPSLPQSVRMEESQWLAKRPVQE